MLAGEDTREKPPATTGALGTAAVPGTAAANQETGTVATAPADNAEEMYTDTGSLTLAALKRKKGRKG
mgnify:CR=1 FL=1